MEWKNRKRAYYNIYNKKVIILILITLIVFMSRIPITSALNPRYENEPFEQVNLYPQYVENRDANDPRYGLYNSRLHVGPGYPESPTSQTGDLSSGRDSNFNDILFYSFPRDAIRIQQGDYVTYELDWTNNPRNVSSVYLLLNAGNAFDDYYYTDWTYLFPIPRIDPGLRDKKFGTVEMTFSDGSILTSSQNKEFDLILGKNIRSWFDGGRFRPMVFDTTSKNNTNAWMGYWNNMYYAADIIKLDLPSEYISRTLKFIKIKSTIETKSYGVYPDLRLMGISIGTNFSFNVPYFSQNTPSYHPDNGGDPYGGRIFIWNRILDTGIKGEFIDFLTPIKKNGMRSNEWIRNAASNYEDGHNTIRFSGIENGKEMTLVINLNDLNNDGRFDETDRAILYLNGYYITEFNLRIMQNGDIGILVGAADTIGKNGCYLVSATMVLNYYGINTDPKKLNRWFQENKGYTLSEDPNYELYLFSWDNIPGNENIYLLNLLNQNYNLDWLKTAIIEKIDNGRTIKVYSENNYLSLSLNKYKTKVNLKIDDGRTDEFSVKTDINGKLIIYGAFTQRYGNVDLKRLEVYPSQFFMYERLDDNNNFGIEQQQGLRRETINCIENRPNGVSVRDAKRNCIEGELSKGIPVILFVTNIKRHTEPHHFILAKGITRKVELNNNIENIKYTYNISDPINYRNWNPWESTLAGDYSSHGNIPINYGNKFSSARILKPSSYQFIYSYLRIIIHSPVVVYISDPTGKHLGFDTTNSFINEITNATYYDEISPKPDDDLNETQSNESEKFSVISIPQPANGIYSIKIIGVDDGIYGINFDAFDAENSFRTKYITGISFKGMNAEYNLEYSSIPGSWINVTQVFDTIPPLSNISMNPSLPDGKNNWYISNIVVNITATDLQSGINRTEYSFDNTTWLNYSSGLTVDKEGTTTIYARSYDNANNIESPVKIEFKLDKTNPITTAALNGSVLNGTFTKNVTLTLTAKDNLSGIAAINYSFDGIIWNQYSEKITINKEGLSRIYFRSEDNASNIEEAKSIDVVISNPLPTLNTIPDITVNETELVHITPTASDPENDPLTFTFSPPLNSSGMWQTTYDDAGEYTATVTVTDGFSNVSQDVKITVLNVNRPPVLAPIGAISAVEGSYFSYNVSASDPDKDQLTYSDDSPMFKINPFTGEIGFVPHDAGNYSFNITVSDGEAAVSANVSLEVRNTNNPPEMEFIFPAAAAVGRNFTLRVNASDADGDRLTYSDDTGLFDINGTTGLIEFTPISEQVGTYFVNITVSDGVETDYAVLNIVVRPEKPLKLEPIQDIIAYVGDLVKIIANATYG